jgi:hypothetical protein
MTLWPLLSLLLIQAPVSQTQDTVHVECLLPAEKRQLETEPKLDNRIKIYLAGSERCAAATRKALASPTPPSVGDSLNNWMQLLELSLDDIQKNSDRKKKSKALIRYEIQVRKSIAELSDLRMKGSYEEMQQIDAWTGGAEAIRKKFVDILFQR